MDLLKTVKCWAYPTASKYISRAMLVEGLLRKSGLPFRCLFIGNSPFTEYLLHKAFTESVHVIRKWKVWMPALKRLIETPPGEPDVCIAVLPVRYESDVSALYAFRGQEYVRQFIDTSITWDEIRKRFHRHKRKFAGRAVLEYGYRVSTEMKDFDFFYHDMHLPHVKKRFGRLADIDSYDNMKHYFLKGFLFFALDGNQPVAGSLCHSEGRTLIARRVGMLNGDNRYVKKGAQMALYCLRLKFAHDHNYEAVDAMKSRPFLDDGIYRTKREWGAAVYPDNESTSWVYYFVPRFTERAVSFFEGNPVIVCTENGLKGVVGMGGAEALSGTTCQKLRRQFHSPGLEGLLLLSPHSPAPVELPFRND